MDKSIFTIEDTVLIKYNRPNETYAYTQLNMPVQETVIVVPEYITAIADYAFYYCDHITKVVLPKGLTSIGNYNNS